MSLNLVSNNEHNGFILSEPFVFHNSLVVLTGRNGCGKTRLLESIQNNISIAEINGEKLSPQEITLVEQAKLTPSFGEEYNDARFQTKITSTLQMYDRVNSQLDMPLSLDTSMMYDRVMESGIPYAHLHKLCNSISRQLGKKASELTHNEIRIYFEEFFHSVLGFQNLSLICNQYIQRKRLNKYHRYLAQHEQEDVSYLTDEQFVETFGNNPWVVINEIIASTFDGKFHFSTPDEQSLSYTYNATLIQRDTGKPVTINVLSSGEKTLLWLALTLFNSQYYKPFAITAPKLLLLDEPDAFLHPKMVVKMYKVLEVFSERFSVKIIITTHSPTTVALSPESSTFMLCNNKIFSITKDEGIAELLDGITQISINPENRRQVFVESQYDADVYQAIFSKLVHSSALVDSKISLNFVSSGPKMPEQQIIEKTKKILNINDDAILKEFVEAVNGVGNCVQVIGQVEALKQSDNETVRGIIDWDLKNRPLHHIAVLAPDYAYSIENITLDPISIVLLLHTSNPDLYKMVDLCGQDINWLECLNNDDHLQELVDRFIYKILGRENKKDAQLLYVSGKKLLTDREYLRMNGHDLETLIKNKYQGLMAHCKKGKDGELKYAVVSKIMLMLTDGTLIPKAYEQVLSDVQK
ncbi:ATP-binding protein [Aeromonas sp. HMWF016]|uniref:ATP-binding protein n=1 Tax=Aeromonas sp. HMWF016 TaxID=2056852 RepID=UPI001C634A5C|nr:AAA family ATPase [Aeromonas sp. HMWF016]